MERIFINNTVVNFIGHFMYMIGIFDDYICMSSRWWSTFWVCIYM